MTDNKLTDNNIKELLEYKAKAHCELCDLKNSGCCDSCIYTVIKQSVDLINRLQAENEKLEIKNSALEYDLSLLRQEREGVVKAEAYKEFAERLKEKYGYYDWENKTIVYPDEEIDNLLKELVGEDNGNREA